MRGNFTARRLNRGLLTGVASTTILCSVFPSHVSSARELPRASYFLVHDKGFAGGQPRRDRSMLWVMQLIVSRGQPTGVRVVKSYRTQYGLRDEAKRRAGDRSTPEGLYQIIHVKKKRRDEVTGPWFFLMSYPNQDDRRLDRTGGAVGIHGGPNRPTLGCVRLRDRERGGQGIIAIENLRQYVETGTPVLSVPELPRWLRGEPGAVLGEEVARFYTHLLTTPLANAHFVRLVREATAGSTAYLAARDEELPQTELVTVSSELNPFGELTYRGYNLIDGNPTTCWAEGAAGGGVGEWVQLRFPTPRLVRRIRMVNGYDKGPRWEQNNRIRRASIQLSDGSSFNWHLADTRAWQEFVLPMPVVSRYVQLSIDAVYRGSRRDWNDTSISELAADSQPLAADVTGSSSGSSASQRARMVAQASSYLEGGAVASGYYPFNAIDDDPSTCWSEGGDGHGVGEWLRISFAEARTLAQIRLINGYDKRQGRLDRWKENPRVKRATLRFSDGTTVPWNLRDIRDWQSIALARPVTTTFVQLTISEVYSGARWEDTSISEIAFTDASATAPSPPLVVAASVPPNVTASSTLDDATSGAFLPRNLIDGDPTTCWSEAVSDPVGEWIRFDFPYERRIYRLRIVNGYDKIDGSQDRWSQNSRVREALLRFSDGTERAIVLRDTREPQTIELPNGKLTKSVQLVIRSTYPGARWQDTSIGEVEFDSTPIELAGSRGSPEAQAGRQTERITATASSTLADPDRTRFAAANVVDGDPGTWWSEGVPGDGIDERIRIEFAQARQIRTILVISGCAKDDLHARSNRPKWLWVQLSDGTGYDWFLEDTQDWQRFRLPQPKTLFFFELVIRDVYRGSIPNRRDTSISEVAVE